MQRALLGGLAALAALLGCALPLACSLRSRARLQPLPVDATAALAEARELTRTRPDGWRARAEEALARASAAAPDWVAPQRVLDDVRRETLLGHEALAARRAALEAGGTAAEHYLAGRLEGRGGYDSLERAARLDPALSWGQHGLAWERFQSGDTGAALGAGRRALELARGSYELGFFANAVARYLLDAGHPEEALELLEECRADARLVEPERTEIEVALARAELASPSDEDVERGFWRGVRLLEDERLSAAETDELGEALLTHRTRAGLPDPLAVLIAALADGDAAARERLRARVWLERGDHALAGAAWSRADGSVMPGAFRRARELERGQAGPALDHWCAALPARLKDDQGLPREPALRTLVLAARASEDADGAARFGAALLAAGWFEEAESWASNLVLRAPDAALALATRAAAGEAVIAGVRGVLERVDERRAAFVPEVGANPGAPRAIGDLDALLESLQPLFERYRGAPLALSLVASPRLTYGGFASIVHPGPFFSAGDERAGRGAKGAAVGGLAAELANLGRFGIFGQAPGGGGPDGTVLRLVGTEWKEGEHLGVRFAGWVAWCEGADVESRPGRLGSGVSGAALHEGYWIDLEGVRRDWERMRALQREYLAPASAAALARALDERGPRLPLQHGRDEPARWMAPLGEGERVLLAALRERPAPAEGAERVSFDEWLTLSALHEEGHLTDRTRFLPLATKWPKVLGLVLRYGFTPRAVARALEYRAQLVALCEASEPRFILADCLEAGDAEGGPLAHGEAYRQLVEDFLAELAAEQPPAVLEPERYFLYQLHALGAADVRRVARALAVRNGMLAP